MADSFRSEVNGSLWMAHWIIGLFNLKRIITIRPIGVWHQSTARAIESRRLLMLLNRFRGTLMSYTDRSVQLSFKSNAPMANGSAHQMVHPIRSKRALRNEMLLCVARRRTVLLCLYIFVGKIEQNRQHYTILTSYLLNSCIRSVSHLHSCDIALSLLLVWYCLTIWCKYETKTQTGAFLPYILNCRDYVL